MKHELPFEAVYAFVNYAHGIFLIPALICKFLNKAVFNALEVLLHEVDFVFFVLLDFLLVLHHLLLLFDEFIVRMNFFALHVFLDLTRDFAEELLGVGLEAFLLFPAVWDKLHNVAHCFVTFAVNEHGITFAIGLSVKELHTIELALLFIANTYNDDRDWVLGGTNDLLLDELIVRYDTT